MTYPNLITAVKSLGRKLYSFAGHHIDATHTSYCFDQMARAICHIANDPTVASVNFDGEVWAGGKTLPVIITVEGADIFSTVDVSIQLA